MSASDSAPRPHSSSGSDSESRGRAGGERLVGVLGVGQMGTGIAQTALEAGCEVRIADAARSRAEAAREGIARGLERRVAKGRLTAEARDAALGRLRVSADLGELTEAPAPDAVIEAVPEVAELKFRAFEELGARCPAGTLLLSNTSSIPITEIAARASGPERVAGMHFMHPVPVMPLVEGVRGLATSDATFARVRRFAEQLGKTFVEARDFPGFCVNRLLMPLVNEAIHALAEGVATAEDIDKAVTLGLNHPMGPLALADFIGLDTCLAIIETLHRGFGDPKYRPSPLLRAHVAAGRLGRKTGQGFFRYDESSRR